MNKELSFFRLITVSLIFSAIFGCTKDKEEKDSNTSNGFSYNGSSYQTPKGYIVGPLISGSGVKGFYVILVSNSIICSWSDEYDDVRALGTGDLVAFTLWTPTNDKPAIGDYTFHSPTGYPVPFEYDGGGVGVNFDCTNEEGLFLEISSGTVKLTETGPNYKITYNFMCQGSVVAGSYSGSLQSIIPPRY